MYWAFKSLTYTEPFSLRCRDFSQRERRQKVNRIEQYENPAKKQNSVNVAKKFILCDVRLMEVKNDNYTLLS